MSGRGHREAADLEELVTRLQALGERSHYSCLIRGAIKVEMINEWKFLFPTLIPPLQNEDNDKFLKNFFAFFKISGRVGSSSTENDTSFNSPPPPIFYLFYFDGFPF